MEVRRFDICGNPLTKDDLVKIHIPEDIVILYNKIKGRATDCINNKTDKKF